MTTAGTNSNYRKALNIAVADSSSRRATTEKTITTRSTALNPRPTVPNTAVQFRITSTPTIADK